MVNATGNLSTTIVSPKNGSVLSTTQLPVHPASNGTIPINDNATELQPLIFLQTKAAQGIAGTFAFAAILITCHQVCMYMYINYFFFDFFV